MKPCIQEKSVGANTTESLAAINGWKKSTDGHELQDVVDLTESNKYLTSTVAAGSPGATVSV